MRSRFAALGQHQTRQKPYTGSRLDRAERCVNEHAMGSRNLRTTIITNTSDELSEITTAHISNQHPQRRIVPRIIDDRLDGASAGPIWSRRRWLWLCVWCRCRAMGKTFARCAHSARCSGSSSSGGATNRTDRAARAADPD